MDKVKFLQFVLFLLRNAEDIQQQIEDLLAFVRNLIDDFNGVDSEPTFGGHYAENPIVSAANAFEASTAIEGTYAAGGFLRDFAKWVIENPEKVLEFILVIKSLFGKETE